MPLAISYRRPVRWWMSVLCAGVSVATAFAVLLISDAAPASVRITGGASGTGGAARSYDLVVRGPDPAVMDSFVASPADLTTISGGITLAQYDKIRRLPGVEVAAPMTMVGYVPLTVTLPVDVPVSAQGGGPRPVTLTLRLRSDNGLSTVTWDDVTVADAFRHEGQPSAMVSVPVSWTFQLPLVAVDPVAEARLLGLKAAVTSGSYLPAAGTDPSGQVPVLIAGSIADGEVADVSVDPQAGGPAQSMRQLTASAAYSELAGVAREKAGTVRMYWTAAPVRYGKAADGGLVPQPVAVDLAAVWGGPYQWAGAPDDAGVLDVPFRPLTPHAALGAGVTVRAVGVFDPARIASAPATPSPYLPELLTGADARSRQLLGGHPLVPDGDPGGYPGAAAALVMPLADIGAFTSGFAGTDQAAPVGIIRVRVAGAAGAAAASRERIQRVAQEIVRATGLRVHAVLASTAVTKVIDLPPGLHGRPALRIDEVWYRSDTRTIVQVGADTQSISLSELDLLSGEVVIAWGIWRLTSVRRRELVTLRALGWRRRQVGEHLLAEFTLTATVAGLAAVLAVYAIGTALVGQPDWAWLLLSIPAAIAMILAASWWPLLRVAARALAGSLSANRIRRPGRRSRPTAERAGTAQGPVRGLLRTPSRTLLGGFAIALACAALSLELAARWAFSGAAQSWAGRSVTWQGTVVDVAAVLVVVAMAVATVADLDWVAARERAGELRTLRAIGWSARDVARLTLRDAVRLGLAGGLAVGVLDLLGGLAVAGYAPLRMMAVAGLATVAGMAMSLLAAGLSVAFRSASNLGQKLTVHLWFVPSFRMAVGPMIESRPLVRY